MLPCAFVVGYMSACFNPSNAHSGSCLNVQLNSLVSTRNSGVESFNLQAEPIFGPLLVILESRDFKKKANIKLSPKHTSVHV